MLIHFIQAIILRLDDQRNEIVYSRPQCPNPEFDPQRSNEFPQDFFTGLIAMVDLAYFSSIAF